MIDQPKREYGVRSRGQVLEILLEGILGDVEDDESKSPDHRSVTTAALDADASTEVTSLVLIESPTERHQQQAAPAPVSTTAGGIVPVTRVNEHILGNDVIGPTTAKILETYWDWHRREDFSVRVVYNFG